MSLIHHIVSGRGSPPLVFVHGFACGLTDWDAQVAHFSGKHRTVAVDLRGHGRSFGQAAECSMERYGADVVEVMRALELPPAIIVGHSLGCRVVTEAALQAPERTAGLILVDGSQFAPAMGAVLRDTFASPGGFGGMVSRLFTDMFTGRSDRAVVDAVVARAARLPREIGERMLTDLQRYDCYRLDASLACLTVPVMALQTTHSNEKRDRVSLSPGQSSPYLDMLRARIPSIHIEVIERCGHFPQLDEPIRTNAAIETFLGRFMD